MKYRLLIGLLIMGNLLFSQEGQGLFQQKCAACHTIGKGRLVGPDLKNITLAKERSWLLPFVRSSQTMIQSGDAMAVAVYQEYNRLMMPDAGLADAEIEAVLDYIEKASIGAAESFDTAPAADMLAGITKENINQGAMLFSGRLRLSAGGMACSSCHKVKDNAEFAQGTLAKELTTTYELMGSAGIAAILKSPPFPAMNNAYVEHPLTGEEVINLTAYLKHVSQNRYYQHTRDYSLLFVILGMFFSMGIILATFVLYFRRKRGSVRDDIYQRQTPVAN